MPGIRAWGDDLVVVLFEFLDDDTKLAQSCTEWLYVQHWYTVVPHPAMRVTLWALMTSKSSSMRLDGYLCEVFHTTFLSSPFLWAFFCGGSDFFRTAAHWSGTRSDMSVCVPHGFALVCAVKQDLSFVFRPVTTPAAVAAMVLAPFVRARRRAM